MEKKEFDKIIKACRFCLMCRHMCTVGNLTYVETHTPRGKALMIDCMGSEALENTPENRKRAAEVLFECCYCGHCQNNCVSSYAHPDAVVAARANVAEEDLPSRVRELRAQVAKTGEIYGDPKQTRGKTGVKDADVLLYVGSFTRNEMPSVAESALRLLERAGVICTVLSEESDPGMQAYFLGLPEKALRQRAGEIEKIDALRPKVVAVLDPMDQRALSGGVPGLGADVPRAPVVGFSAYVKQLADEGKLKWEHKQSGAVAYHDDDQGGRFLNEFDAPRELIRSMPGVEYAELFWTGGEAASAGESGMTRALNPRLAERIAQKRWLQLEDRGLDVIVTDSPGAKAQLSETAGENGIRVLHIAEWLENCI